MESANFSIGSLSVDTPIAVDGQGILGDDMGGIAVSASSVFFGGDSDMGRWNLGDLGDAAGAGVSSSDSQWLVSDLQSQTAYVFNVTGSSGDWTLTGLTALDGATGDPTGPVVDLSADISLTGSADCRAVGAGWSRIAIWDGCDGTVDDIDEPSVDVTVSDAALFSDFALAPLSDWEEDSSQSGR